MDNERLVEKNVRLLKALAHPVRLSIIKYLLDHTESNVNTFVRGIGVPQSTISQHLAKLRDIEIVKTRREGTEVIYLIKDDRARQLVQLLFSI